MFKSLCLASVLCLLALWSPVAGARVFNASATLEDICKDEKAPLYRISEIKAIADLLDSGFRSAVCDDVTIEALTDLAKLAEHIGREGCTRSGTNLVAAYKSKHYLNVHLRRAVRRFFVALGFRLSESCRIHMIWNLEDAKSALRKEDAQVFDGLLWDGKFAPTPKERADEELDIVTQLSRLRTQLASTEAKIFIQVAPGNRFGQIKSVCANRLEPVYKEVLSPVVELWGLGFTYTEKQVQNSVIRTSPEFRKLLRQILLCEALANVQIIASDEDLRGGQVKVLTDEQALELQALESARAGHRALAAANANEIDNRIYRYHGLMFVRMVKDLVLDELDLEFVRMIDKYSTEKSATDRQPSGLLQTLLHKARTAFRNRQLILSGPCARSAIKLTDDQAAICELEKLLFKEQAPQVSYSKLAVSIIIGSAVFLFQASS